MSGALLALLSPVVQALGLGAIDVESRLGEPFRAEVPITNVSTAELQSLLAGPANLEDFQRAGLAENLPPVHLEFETERRADGTVVINVTSAEPVIEPTLDFLLAVQWSGGRLVREYTALLNPGPVRLAPVALPATPAARGAAAKATPPTTARAPKISLDGRYTVRKGDSLWRIARAVHKKNGISIQTLVDGIAAANPEAFRNHDLNFLKRGVELRIPAVGELFAPVKVAAAVSSMPEPANSAPSEPATATPEAAPPSPAGSGEITPNVSPSATESAGELRIRGAAESATPGKADQSGADAAGGAVQAEVNDLEGRIATLEEQLLSKGLENDDLRKRVQVLEQQVQHNDTLLALNEPELAMATSAPAATTPAPVMNAVRQPPAVEAADADAAPHESSSTPSGASPADGVTTASPLKAIATASAAKFESKHALPDAEISRSRLVPPWITDILASLTPTRLFAVLATLLLGIVALFFVRHRRPADSDYFVPAADDATMSLGPASSGVSGHGAVPAVSEAAAEPSGAPLDPLAEADVLLAYGRLPQARQVLERALRVEPRDTGLRVKLLEVVCQQRDTPQFESLARSFRADFAASHPGEWRRVMTMGRSLAPDNPLFAVAVNPPRANESEAATTPPPAGSDDTPDPQRVELSLNDDPSTVSPQDASSPDTAASNVVEWDSPGTRLDLARTYIEIGDHEAARKLLDTVQRDGSAEQRQAAERLAERLQSDPSKP